MAIQSFATKITLPASLLLLLIGIVVYSAKKHTMAKTQASPPIAYTLVQERVTTFPNHPPKIESVTTRYVASDGNFVEKRDDGKKQYLAFSRNGKYLRMIDDGANSHLVEVGGYNASPYTEASLQRAPNLAKDTPTQTIAGVKCYVVQHESDSDSMTLYIAPSLGIPLQVIRTQKPTNVVTTIKPISLTFGEPDPVVFANLPVQLPVKALHK